MDQKEISLSGNDAVVREVLRSYISDFATRGFEFVGVDLVGSTELGQFPEFNYVNKRREMKMAIGFSSAKAGLNGGFGVWLNKLEKPNGLLNVEDYLRQKGQDEFIPVFTYRDPGIDIHDYAERFFQTLKTLLDTVLKSVIEGDAFEVTPIDWMGFK